jgi:hypothetical protein
MIAAHAPGDQRAFGAAELVRQIRDVPPAQRQPPGQPARPGRPASWWTRPRARSSRDPTAAARRPASRSTREQNSFLPATTISAAADGVGGANVGDEVGDRDVGLVADRGDHRDRAPRDRARDRPPR